MKIQNIILIGDNTVILNIDRANDIILIPLKIFQATIRLGFVHPPNITIEIKVGNSNYLKVDYDSREYSELYNDLANRNDVYVKIKLSEFENKETKEIIKNLGVRLYDIRKKCYEN